MTIKEVYGKDISEIKAPDGYEFTGEFREPGNEEYYLSVVDLLYLYPALALRGSWSIKLGPRLILKEI